MAIKRISELKQTSAAEINQSAATKNSLFEVSLGINEINTNELPSRYESRSISFNQLVRALGINDISDEIKAVLRGQRKFSNTVEFDSIVCNNITVRQSMVSQQSNKLTGNVVIGDPGEASTCDGNLVDQNLPETEYNAKHTHYPNTSGGSLQIYYPTKLDSSLKVEDDAFFCADVRCRATRAYWGDLAERYVVDADYEPGTLVKFGGPEEMTIAKDGDVNAVITTAPGFILNNKEDADPTKIYKCIALTGRVPVKVKGKVNKFDKIYLSSEPGIASTKKSLCPVLIGRALQSKETEEIGLVECVVQLSLA